MKKIDVHIHSCNVKIHIGNDRHLPTAEEFKNEVFPEMGVGKGVLLPLPSTKEAGANLAEICHKANEEAYELVKTYPETFHWFCYLDPRIEGDLSEEELADYDKFMAKFVDVIEFAEVGEGTLRMKEIIEAGLESGAKYFIVEQDDTYGRDPFDSLKISAENLRELGYGEWF